MREARERDRKLTLRHRWYAGGIATVLSGALIFTGVAPAVAEETPAPVDATTSETTDASTADETTSEDSTPEESTLEESTTPEKSEAAPDTTKPAPETKSAPETKPAPEKSTDALDTDELAFSVTPMSIVDPTPVTGNNTTLRVKKLGARNSAGGVDVLSGARFEAYASTRGGTRFGSTTLTCTTDATGTCEIVVPNRTGGRGSNTQGYWVREAPTGAPSGWLPVGNLGLGAYDAAKTSTPYSYFTNNVSGNSTIHLITEDAAAYRANSNLTQSPQTSQNGFANVRSNPAFPSSCGLSIAVVFDKSSSISSSEMTLMRNAALGFVGTSGLGGTPSSVALYEFSTTASKLLNLTSIAANQTAVNTAINNNVTAAGSGYTNWDDAFRKVAFNPQSEKYDVVLFLTDGDPTVNGTGGSNIETDIGFRNIEEGVFSANALKAVTFPDGHRTKVVAVGIGLQNGSSLNLAAISGPNTGLTGANAVNNDYYTTGFPELQSTLRNIALANCGGSVTVVKKTINADGSVEDALAGGWTFTGTTTGAWIKREGQSNASSLALTTPHSGTSEGAVNFPIDLSTASSRTLTITENVNSGYTADSVSCNGATHTGTAASFSVPVTQNAIISCTVTNRKLPPTQLKLVKAFTGTAYGPHVPADWTLTATNGGTTTNFAHNETKPVTAGTQYTISEIGKTGYEQVGPVVCNNGTFQSPDKITVAPNTTATCTVTNKSNPAKLRIVKQDTAGQPLSGATFQLWRETGAANGLQASAPNQDTLVNGSINAGTFDANDLTWGTYYVKEIAAPAGYTIASPDTQTVVLGAGDTVTAKTVTFQNAEIKPKLTLKKIVVNNGIGTREAKEWTLAAGAPDWNGTAIGSGATASTAKQEVPANTDITLGETGPVGYTSGAWTCDSGITVTNGKINLPRAADVTCTITNTVKTHTVKLKKEWTNGLNGASAALSISSGGRTSTPVTSNVGDAIDAKVATLEVAVGATVSLSEVVSGPGTYSTTLDCNPQQSLTATDDRHQSFVAPAQNVTCTFRNASNSVTVELIKVWAGQPFAGDQAALNIKSGDEVLTTGTSTAPTTTTISASARIGDELVLSEALGSMNQGAYDTSWTCTNGVQAPANGSVATAKITVTGAFSCTVTNTPKTVKVKVNKHWVNGFTGDAANITVNGGTPGTSTIDAQDGNETDLTVIEKVVRVGETVNISESLPASNTGSYDSHYRCGTASFVPGTSTSVVKIQADTTCEFKNTAKTLKVYLQKQWIEAVQGDQATLSMTGAANKTSTANGQNGSWVDAGNVLEATVRVGDQVSFSETLNSISGAQYTTVSSCWSSGQYSSMGTGTSFSIAKLPAETFVTCVFTNESVRGDITLLKEVDNGDGGTAADTDWTLNGAGPVAISGVEGHANVTNVSVPAGTYVLTETNGPAGYQQTDLECTGGTLTEASGQTPASVVVPADGDVVCTFYNDDIAPKLTLKKKVVNTGGGTQAATAWTLTAQNGDNAPVISEQGTSNDGGASATTATVPVKAKVGYTLSESVIAGYTPGDWSCAGQGGSLQAGAVTLQLGANVVCEITNTAIPATGEHTKKVTSISQGASGVWEIVYEIVVTNTSAASTLTYGLADDLRFGSGIVVQDASWSGPAPATTPTAFADTTSTTITTVPLPQNATGDASHVYTVTVHATIADFPVEGDTWQDCALTDGENGTGLLNTSALTIGESTTYADACDAPEFPSVAKTAGAPVQNATTGAWTVRFQIVVKTTGGAGDPAVQTVATEILPEIQTGWTLLGNTWSVNSGANTPALNTTSAPGVPFAFFSGAIPAGSTYTYNVTGVVTPDSESTTHLGLCGQNGGLINSVTVTSGAASDDAAVCVEIPVSTVSVDKEATSVAQNEDGTWLVTYLVSVTNDSGEVAAVYDLTDAPLFGTDASADDVRWAPANAAGVAQGAFSDSTPIADDKVLAGGATDYYLVQVTATIDPEAWVEGEDGVLTLPCPTGWESPNGEDGGLRNSATATAGGESDTDFGCIEPRQPKVVKDPVSVVQDAVNPNQWRVSYRITVTPNGTEVYYDLGDQPHFASGVNVLSGSAQRIDTDPDGPVISNIASDGTPFTGPVKLEAASAPHEYLVTWLVSIPAQIPAELRECGEAPAEGQGFFNTAILTVSGVEQTDDACADIDEKVYPDLTKTVTDLSRDPDTKEWTITYGIDVSLPGSEDLDPEGESLNPKNLAGGYILDEELDYDVIEIVAAEWRGHTAGLFAAGSDRAHLAPLGDIDVEKIDAGDTHSYTVTVRAKLNATDLRERTIGCTVQSEARGLGFFNQATLAFGEDLEPIVRDACTVPVYPDVEKSAVSVTDNPDGTQRVEYLVTVTSPALVANQPVTNVIYTLTEEPAGLPDGVTLGGDDLWHAENADDDTPTPDAATWNGTGTWHLQAIAAFSKADREAGALVHTYRVWADLEVTSVPDELPDACDGETVDGIPIWNTVSLASGEYEDSATACEPVHFDDVALVKTSVLPEGQDSVEPGDQFDYVLTVTNNGTRDATGVRVTDATINDRLEIVSVAASAGFTFTGPGYTGNDVDLTLNEPLAAGESVVVTVRVEFLPASGGDVPDLIGGEEAPTLPDPLEQLDNTACVAADADDNLENNCDSETVLTRDLTATVFTRCVNDAPLLGWTVKKSESLRDLPISFVWTPNQGVSTTVPPNVELSAPGGQLEWSDLIRWPGTAFTPSGVSIDFPGWRPLEASDYGPNGGFIYPADGLEYAPEDAAFFIFNGLILDDSELDYAWRNGTTITFSVNPELTFSASYPDATPECFVARHTEVQIEKTASVERSEPGKSFTYTLAVANVSDDAAADGVVVTDQIPADVKVTDVTWAGKGDADVFPNWESCAVTGQNGSGYGGTLICELFGPLQPINADNGGASVAPTITLQATVNPASKASVITNVAVVDYHTFGDPDDPGRDSDDATVLLSALPATGSSPLLPLVMLGFLALLAGAATVVITRRRRGEAKPTV